MIMDGQERADAARRMDTLRRVSETASDASAAYSRRDALRKSRQDRQGRPSSAPPCPGSTSSYPHQRRILSDETHVDQSSTLSSSTRLVNYPPKTSAIYAVQRIIMDSITRVEAQHHKTEDMVEAVHAEVQGKENAKTVKAALK